MRKIINYIPDMPDGWSKEDSAPWRDALGYAWQDLDNRVPGDDRRYPGDLEAVKNEILAEYPNAKIAEQGPVWDLDLETGEKLKIDPSHHLAIVFGQWCGGFSWLIYDGEPEIQKPFVPSEPILNPNYAGMTPAQIRKAEIDYDNLYNEGCEGYNPYRDNLYIQRTGDR